MKTARTATKEEVLAATYEAARKAENEANKALEAHFMPLIDKAILSKDKEEAQRLILACPTDSITRVFMMDRFRQGFPK